MPEKVFLLHRSYQFGLAEQSLWERFPSVSQAYSDTQVPLQIKWHRVQRLPELRFWVCIPCSFIWKIFWNISAFCPECFLISVRLDWSGTWAFCFKIFSINSPQFTENLLNLQLQTYCLQKYFTLELLQWPRRTSRVLLLSGEWFPNFSSHQNFTSGSHLGETWRQALSFVPAPLQWASLSWAGCPGSQPCCDVGLANCCAPVPGGLATADSPDPEFPPHMVLPLQVSQNHLTWSFL